MNKTELAVVRLLLGFKSGPVRVLGGGVYRDVIGSRAHKVCEALEADGIGRIEKLDHIAFRFATYDKLHAEGKIG